MIYLKNNTETQAIYIPRQTVLGGGYIPSTKAYDKGYNDGFEDGKEQQKGKLSNLNVTENGQYEREDGWNVVTVDVPDLNGSYNEGYEQGYEDGYNQGQAECPDCPELTEIAITENGRYEGAYNVVNVDVPTEGGSCNLGEGEFVFRTSDVGRYELNASDDGYDGWSKIYLEIEGEGAIKIHKAADLLDAFNNGAGLDYGWNYYVGGEITEIQEISTQYGNATYILDNGFKIYRGKWIDGNGFSSEDQIKVGAYIVVYGVLAEYKGTLQLNKNSQVIAYQECTGGEIISCNLEDKSVTPSMSDRDSNGYIVVSPSEGYDGLSRTVIDPQTIYNDGIEAGKTEKETDLAANARVLNVTENGVYKSKFSDPIIPANYTVTGVYADGTKFYSYAQLGGKVFNTNIPATTNSRIEFWYKGDNTLSGDAYNVIMGAHYMGDLIVFEVIYNIYSNSEVSGRIGSTYFNTNWDESIWHHIILSVNDGFVVDGAKIGDMQSASYTSNGNFLINANDYNNQRNANGCFGMIKIDDTIIIPTADGFLNTNTGELLEVVKDGTYTFTENLPIYSEGELYKTINVNVPSVQDEALQYDTIAFSYTVYNWSNHNINRDNMTTNCGDRPLDCLLFRNRLGECTVMTKLDNCSGTAQLENGWTEDNIIRTLKSKTITKFLSNSINSNQLTSIDTGLAQLKENAIINCNALTDIKLAILNNNLSVQFASNCFNGLPAEGTITISKTADVTLTDDEITSFFRTIVGEGWTITIK